jgi:hypothetical protein
MVMKKRLTVIALIIVGLLFILLSIFSDLLRGRQFSIGLAQWGLFIFGLLVFVIAYLYKIGRLGSLAKTIYQWFINLPSKPKFGKIVDLVFLSVIILYSFVYFLGCWGGLSTVFFKNGDAGALLSYATATNSPNNFLGDQSLDLTEHVVSYPGFYLPFIRSLGAIVGDYGLAFLILQPICIFLQLFSFYLLGKELFKNRFWAIILSLTTAIYISYGYFDFWGLSYDPLPRFVFQSIMPFLLLLFLKWTDKPKRWTILMVLTSLLFFVHVISAPCIAFMLWLGFFLYLPKIWSLSRKILFQLINGLFFIIPFIIFSLSSKSSSGFTNAQLSVSYLTIMQYLTRNFGAFLDQIASIKLFIQVLNNYYLLIPFIIGFFVIYITKTHKELKTNLILLWLSACLIISLIIPAIEHAIEKSMGIPPVEIDLVRNLRYAIPLIEIICIAGFIAIQKYLFHLFQAKKIGGVLVILVYLVGCFWPVYAIRKNSESDQMYNRDFVAQEINCLAKGKLFCPIARKIDEAAVLNFIHDDLAVDAKFLSVPNDAITNEIRYAGQRSVVYTSVDKNRIVFSDFPSALKIENIQLEWAKHQQANDFQEWAFKLSCDMGATYWLVDKNVNISLLETPIEMKKIYENNSYAVVELPKCEK